MKKAIGIDIGGTKTAIAIINQEGTITQRYDYPTETNDSEKLFELIVKGINRLLVETKTTMTNYCGIGLGVPGKVDEVSGIAIYQNNILWHNFPIVERLSTVYPQTKIKIDNDVKVAAYAEYRLLQPEANDMFTYLTISTGIACTNIINEMILRGSGFSGEVGFLQIKTPRGTRTLESIASGPAIADYGQLLYDNKDVTTADVFRLWEQGDDQATTIINESMDAIAKTLYAIICLLDPKYIVLGGSVALKNPQYIHAVKQRLAQYLHPEQEHILHNITLSKLDGHNGLIGAGLLVIP